MKQPGQLFEIGQPVTPISSKPFKYVKNGQAVAGPKFGQVYHVSKTGTVFDNPCMELKEFGGAFLFLQTDFAPVLTDEQFCTLYGTIEDQKPVLETAKNGMHAY